MTDLIKLKGTIKKILFPRVKDPDNDFMIAIFGNNKAETIVKGNVHGANEKDELIIEGEWVDDKKYGKQFNIINWERPMPSSKDAVYSLLTSNIIKGCGPKTAQLIVEALGDNAIDIINEQKETCLLNIPGVKKNYATKIVKSLEENYGIQNIVKAFGRYGVTANMASKLHQLYGSNAIPIIENNPYELTNLNMVGFDKADNIARNMGIAENSSYRCESAILHLLKEQSGHCFITINELINECIKMLNEKSKIKKVTSHNINWAIDNLVKARRIVRENSNIYLTRIYNYEVDTAFKLGQLITSYCHVTPEESITNQILQYQRKNQFVINAKQKEAIQKIFKNNIVIITGGPGTGKTAIIKAIVHVYSNIYPNKQIALCAPTGRASQKLTEVVGFQAQTIHKLLNWGIKENDEMEDKGEAQKNEQNPLDKDLIIIDELSMTDIELMATFLAAVKPDTKLVFVGDADQLPSVGQGAVIRDMLKSPIPHIRLTEIYRQAKNSFIIENAHRVNNGEMIYTNPSRKDFFFINQPDAESTVRSILACVKRLLALGYKSEDILILSPMKKGIAGTLAIGEAVKALVNPPHRNKDELFIGDKSFRTGDVIIQNKKNNVERDLYNGNIGIITNIGPDDKGITGLYCLINGTQHFLSREDITTYDFNTAYCITTHKSQGGQAKVVIAPVITSHYVMLTRNILYTAMTRAEEMLILIGQKKAAAIAINNVKPNMYRTCLKYRIENCLIDETLSVQNSNQ